MTPHLNESDVPEDTNVYCLELLNRINSAIDEVHCFSFTVLGVQGAVF